MMGGFGFGSWVWFRLIGVVSAAVLGFSCCAWFQLLGLVSAAGFGFSCWVWFQQLCLVSAAGFGFSCCAWFQLLGLVSAAGFGFSCCLTVSAESFGLFAFCFILVRAVLVNVCRLLACCTCVCDVFFVSLGTVGCSVD